MERLRDAHIRQIVVTDSIPLPPEKQLPNIVVLSVAELLADAIKRIHDNRSVSELFQVDQRDATISSNAALIWGYWNV